ncbi:MAG: hypothetical protein JSU70_07655 [Phycisphaerales bacterium]|nr:MAG: hypothetical protein JSU70_07655 [Phycisphaerales bacterium]
MIDDRMRSALIWLGAGGGSFVPGYSYFTSYPPPLFPGIGLITAALTGAMIYMVYAYTREQRMGRLSSLLRASRVLLTAALVLLVVYVVMLRYCTVLPPRADAPRCQIGFGKCDWSLTEAGLALKRSNHGSESVMNWMLAEAAFQPGGAEKLWKPWSILLSGITMIIVYLAAFACWTCGFAVLAKHYALKRERDVAD